ncbi:MAG: hypothetical protein Q8S21_02535 [Candidatus Paracaedibacteraceae bacterium]|nr:hypothetical protein [Candidatus Paracaedibacteraceae bacterium]
MKKIAVLTALFAITPMFAFAATDAKAHKEPHTVVPAMKDDNKDHHDIKKHDAAHKNNTQKTKDEYVNELKGKIKEIKSLVEAEKEKASPELFAIASLKITVAENWLKTIESYKDPVTRYVRSVKYALNELKMAKRAIHAKLDVNVVDDKDVAIAIEKLKKLSADLVKDKDTVTLREENAACFAALIQSANDYVELATKTKSKKSFKSLTGRAKKYLRDGKKFLNAHKLHERRHASKKNNHEKKKANDVAVVVAPAISFAPASASAGIAKGA